MNGRCPAFDSQKWQRSLRNASASSEGTGPEALHSRSDISVTEPFGLGLNLTITRVSDCGVRKVIAAGGSLRAEPSAVAGMLHG